MGLHFYFKGLDYKRKPVIPAHKQKEKRIRGHASLSDCR